MLNECFILIENKVKNTKILYKILLFFINRNEETKVIQTIICDIIERVHKLIVISNNLLPLSSFTRCL